jgi:3-dehydroquinate dehydratase
VDREDHISKDLGKNAAGTVTGFGLMGYKLAIQSFLTRESLLSIESIHIV